ncbi:MAG: dual specificity protein phosphatase family protein [Thermodesulfobacteriota bacterium]
MPQRFSWIIEDVLAGMERPGSFFSLEEDLEFLKNLKIEVIVNLEEHYMDYNGFEVKHIPINDFKAPQLQDFEEFVDFINSKLEEKKRIVVHCYAGMGRTNVMLASYLIHRQVLEPDKALNVVRERRPIHYVSEEQEEALREYFYTLDRK